MSRWSNPCFLLTSADLIFVNLLGATNMAEHVVIRCCNNTSQNMLTPTPPIDKRSGRLFDRKNIKIHFCCLECIVLRLHFVAGKNIRNVKTWSVTHQFICICENMSRHCNCLWTMHCKSSRPIERIARVLTQIRMWLLWHL